jgi:small subunit ribosomal protein S3Ae
VKNLVVRKAKTKDWYTIVAPKYFNEKEIGKTLASEPELLIGRRIVVSAVDLTNNFNKYYLKLIFRIHKIDGNKALAEFDGSECLRDYISRMVLRRVRRIDTVQDFVTKDGVKIRIKGLAVIGRRVKSSIQENVKRQIESMLKSMVEGLSFEELVKKIISDEIKNRILQEAKRIYPVRYFEIRKTEVLR